MRSATLDPNEARASRYGGFNLSIPELNDRNMAVYHLFGGFNERDFDVFAIPGFADRLSALRQYVRPKLLAFGAALAPRLSAATGLAFFPHAAQHARRTTNPPDDTWAALARSSRGYQRYAHFAIGLELTGAYVRLVLKAGSDDKKTASAALARHGRDLLTDLPSGCFWYDSDHPVSGTAVEHITDADVMLAAARLDQRKTASLAVGFALPRAEAQGAGFLDTALARCLDLMPLYRAVTAPDARA